MWKLKVICSSRNMCQVIRKIENKEAKPPTQKTGKEAREQTSQNKKAGINRASVEISEIVAIMTKKR